jgi:hypothetical protein
MGPCHHDMSRPQVVYGEDGIRTEYHRVHDVISCGHPARGAPSEGLTILRLTVPYHKISACYQVSHKISNLLGILLKVMLNNWNGKLWTESVWIRIWTSAAPMQIEM